MEPCLRRDTSGADRRDRDGVWGDCEGGGGGEHGCAGLRRRAAEQPLTQCTRTSTLLSTKTSPQHLLLTLFSLHACLTPAVPGPRSLGCGTPSLPRSLQARQCRSDNSQSLGRNASPAHRQRVDEHARYAEDGRDGVGGNARAAGIRSPTGAARALVDPGHVRLALPKLKLLVKR